MTRPDRGEMPAVEGDDEVGVQSFGKCYDGSVSAAEREVPILVDQVRDACPVFSQRRFDFEGGHAREKPRLNYSAKPLGD